MCARASQKAVQRLFQPGGPMAVASQIADQMLAQRRFRIPPGRRIAGDPLRGKIPGHLQQKRGSAVAVPVQKSLTGAVGAAVKPGVAVFSRKAERQIPRFQPGEQIAAAIVKVASPCGKRKLHRALCIRPGGVGTVLRQKVQPAQNNGKSEQQS